MATKKVPVRRKKVAKKPNRLIMALFVVVFGVIGVVVLKSSFAAYPTELRISAIVGLPGGTPVTFNTTNHTLGTCNSWDNLSFTVVDGISCTGNTIGNSPSDPVYLHAPTSPRSGYTFDHWGGQCYATSGTQCTVYVPVGSSYDVYPVYRSTAPPVPPAPVVTVTVSPGSVAYNGSTTVSWSATNSPTSCSNNFGASTGASGSKLVTSLTASRSFTVTCTNAGGSGSSSKSVVVASQQTNTGGSGGGGGGGSSSGGSGGGTSGGGSTGGTTKTTTRSTPTASPQAIAADKIPPSVPTGFTASVEDDRPVVLLSWEAANDNTGVTSYKIERSADQKDWKELTSGSTDLSYTDSDIAFKTHYFYRLQAFDAAANGSGYAQADITTLAFKVNITKAEGGNVSHEDGAASVTFPAGAISEDAACSLEDAGELPPVLKGYVTIHGPYQVVCKTASGQSPEYLQPLVASVTVDSKERSKYAGIVTYVGQGNDWQQAGSDVTNITLENGNHFVVYGKTKQMPIWLKLLLLLLLIGVVIGCVLAVKYWRYRQSKQNVYDDYYRKSHGY